MKQNPGWKTTEFWLTLVVAAGCFALLLAGKVTLAEIGELWPIFLGTGAYAVARGSAKRNRV